MRFSVAILGACGLVDGILIGGSYARVHPHETSGDFELKLHKDDVGLTETNDESIMPEDSISKISNVAQEAHPVVRGVEVSASSIQASADSCTNMGDWDEFIDQKLGNAQDRRVTVRFIRHAESDQNAHDDKKMSEDNYKDARLSQKGVQQAMALAKFVTSCESESTSFDGVYNASRWLKIKKWFNQTKELEKKQNKYKVLFPPYEGFTAESDAKCQESKFLRGAENSSEKVLIGTSSLSRAILTGVIGFRERIQKLENSPNDATSKVHMLSLLEEATSGPTSQMSVGPCEFPKLQGMKGSNLLTQYPALAVSNDSPSQYYGTIGNRFDLSGAKVDRNNLKGWEHMIRIAKVFTGKLTHVPKANKEQRFLSFCDWALSEPDVNNVIAVGHSNWIREFLISRLVGEGNELETVLTQDSPKVKLGNASVLKFTIEYDADPKKRCKVVPDKTTLVFGTLLEK